MSSPAMAVHSLPDLSGFPPGAAAPGSGWLYDLLKKAGVSPSDANTVVEFVV